MSCDHQVKEQGDLVSMPFEGGLAVLWCRRCGGLRLTVTKGANGEWQLPVPTGTCAACGIAGSNAQLRSHCFTTGIVVLLCKDALCCQLRNAEARKHT